MKKTIFIYILLVLAGLQWGCSKSFLDVEPRGQFVESFYYSNQAEAYNGLIAVYDAVGWQGGGFVTKINTLDAGSDDHVAGGGSSSDINDLQVFSRYEHTPAIGPQGELWRKGWSGVFRANILLQKLPEVPMDETLKKRYAAEAKFLRAYFYFDLVRFFKSIPLLTKPVLALEMFDVEQVAPAEIYVQMEKDLNEAITDLPPVVPGATEGGRASKAAAYALLGKVLLWQEKWGPAATAFAAVNGTPGDVGPFGHKLLTKFSDLWKVKNKFNTESVFEISFTSNSAGVWDCVGCTEGNLLNILTAPRSYSRNDPSMPDFVSGWGFMVVKLEAVAAFETGDPRRDSSIINIKALSDADLVEYSPSEGNTGWFLTKFMGRESTKSSGAGAVELNFPQNIYDTRLADIYLYEAEALVRGGGDITRAANLINAVRDRAFGDNTHHVAATLDNIKKERRVELLGEGHRWLDIVRWGDAATLLAGRGFKPKHAIFPIPVLELENTKIKQTTEWTAP